MPATLTKVRYLNIGSWTDELPADISNLEFRSTVKNKKKTQVTKLKHKSLN